MRILAFYEGAGLYQDREELLIEQWKTEWKRFGWQPEVVSSKDCINHPRYEEMRAKANSFPYVTDPFFHRKNFVRWLAFDQAGGGVLADYDVFPRRQFSLPDDRRNINGTVALNPGFIRVSRAWVQRFIEVILSYNWKPTDVFEGNPHVSDMVIMQNNGQLFDCTIDLCRIFGDPGWENAPLTHFSNSSLRFRHQLIPYLLRL